MHATEPAQGDVTPFCVIGHHLPTASEYWPAGTSEHTIFPTCANVPAGQSEGATAGLLHWEPAGHCVQEAAPSAENVPAEHDEHAVIEPVDGEYLPAAQ